jgi:hypothetical protein
MIHEMMHMGSQKTAVLFAASLFRDLAPWVYEAGLEAYRALKAGHAEESSEAVAEFRQLADMMTRGPWAREMYGRGNREAFMLLEEIPMMLREVFAEPESKRLRRRKGGPDDELLE